MNNNSGILTNVLNGINSTLNIANKVIPIYKEAKPIINSVTSTYKKIKDNSKEIPKLIKLMNFKNEIKKDQKINISTNIVKENNRYSSINNPKFFI